VNPLRDQFLLEPDVVFLNHGSFGATPADVFAEYQAWSLRLERQPVRLLQREIDGLLREARIPLAAFMNADPEGLVFIENATTGVNIAARALCRAGAIGPGDEVLTTDHEYGACVYAWEAELARVGARLVVVPIPTPLETADAFVARLFAGVTARTRAVFMSHITSATALTFPAAAVCAQARAHGLLTVIDGAHAPGQIPLDVTAIGADYYTGNLHKWLCAPKGAAFLSVAARWQAETEPPMVSWGYAPGASFTDRMHMQGTRDPAAYLSVPAALAFAARPDVTAARHAAYALTADAHTGLCALPGTAPLSAVYADAAPGAPRWFAQMAAVALPPCSTAALKTALLDRYHVEIPVYEWNGRPLVRISVAVYTSSSEVGRLLSALGDALGDKPSGPLSDKPSGPLSDERSDPLSDKRSGGYSRRSDEVAHA
jgi:isopenicillin-N epimerase